MQGMSLNQALNAAPHLHQNRLEDRAQGAGRANRADARPYPDPTAGGDIQVAVNDRKLQIEANGAPFLDFEKGAPITVVPMSSNAFFVNRRDHTRIAFSRDEVGRATGLVLNSGAWQITAQRIN
jgi:hypothetical protein